MSNANILLQNIRGGFTPGENRRRAQQSANADMQTSVNALNFRKGMQDMQRSEDARSALQGANIDWTQPDAYNQAAGALSSVAPMQAAKFAEQGMARRKTLAEISKSEAELLNTNLDTFSKLFNPYRIRSQQDWDTAIQFAKENNLNVGGLEGTEYSPEVVEGIAASSLEAKDALDYKLKQEKAGREKGKAGRDEQAHRMRMQEHAYEYGTGAGGGGPVAPGPQPMAQAMTQPAAQPVAPDVPPAPNPNDPIYRGSKGRDALRADRKARNDALKARREGDKEEREIFETKMTFKNKLNASRDRNKLMKANIEKIRAIINENDLIEPYGYGAGVRSFAPGDANKIKFLLKTLVGNVGFGELQAMRDASKTGGAVGQLSDRELVLLASMKGSLEITNPDLPGTLDTIEQSVDRLLGYMEDAYQGFDVMMGGTGELPGEQADPLGIR